MARKVLTTVIGTAAGYKEVQVSYTCQTRREVWDETNNEHWTVGPDAGATTLVMMQSMTKDNSVETELVMDRDQAELFAKAILACVEELRAADKQ